MPFSGGSGKSLTTRFRGLLGQRSRTLCVGVFLLGGLLSGTPIPPEQIEEHMRSMSMAKMVQVLEDGQQRPGDVPLDISELLDRGTQ